MTTTTTSLARTTETTGSLPGTTTTTLGDGNRTDVFEVDDVYGNRATVTVEVDGFPAGVNVTVEITAGSAPSCGISEFRQGGMSWSVGISGNVVLFTSSEAACFCLNATCGPGQHYVETFGPPWPVASGAPFDPAQPFVLVWNDTALLVD